MADLVSLLAGGDPMAPEEVGGGIAATLGADPSRLAYSSGPVGQALGQISGGFYQGQAVKAAQQIAQAHTEALPALGRAYSSDNPWQTIANDPDAPAYAKWLVLQQTPNQVAQAKEAYANAGLAAAQIPRQTALGTIATRRANQPPDTGLPTMPSPGGAAAPPGAATGEDPRIAAEISKLAAMPPASQGPYLRELYKNNPTLFAGIMARTRKRPAATAAPSAAPTEQPPQATSTPSAVPSSGELSV